MLVVSADSEAHPCRDEDGEDDHLGRELVDAMQQRAEHRELRVEHAEHLVPAQARRSQSCSPRHCGRCARRGVALFSGRFKFLGARRPSLPRCAQSERYFEFGAS